MSWKHLRAGNGHNGGEQKERGLGIRMGEIVVPPLSDCDLGQAVDLSGLHFPLTFLQHPPCRVVVSIGKNRCAMPKWALNK